MRRTSAYILAWLLWAITIIIGAFVTYMIYDAIPKAVRVVISAAAGNDPHLMFQAKYTGDAVDRLVLIVLALVLIVWLVFVEAYYRAGVDRGELARRFAMLATIEFGTLFVALAIQVIVSSILGLFTFSGLSITLGALALTVLGSWVVMRLPKGSDAPPLLQ
jgi:hypothetical protein